MRPLAGAVLVAVVGFTVWAFAAPASKEDGSVARGRFLDALSPGDRIEIPQDFTPPGAPSREGEGVNIFVLTDQQVREHSISPEERDELTSLRSRMEEGDSLNEQLRQRLAELGAKAQRHPLEVIEVGEDYVAYGGWSGSVTYLPERRIRGIIRPMPVRAKAAAAEARPR